VGDLEFSDERFAIDLNKLPLSVYRLANVEAGVALNLKSNWNLVLDPEEGTS
jgi:hypothetical protein